MVFEKTIPQIKDKFSESILKSTESSGEKILHLKSKVVYEVLKFLKDKGFNFLVDITALDNLTLGGFERFSVVYHLLSHESCERMTVKAYVEEHSPILPSVESLWKTADWQEREIYDLFGITFDGHPNMIRIMNPDDFPGHPLRKDYPRLGLKTRDDFPIIKPAFNKKNSIK